MSTEVNTNQPFQGRDGHIVDGTGFKGLVPVKSTPISCSETTQRPFGPVWACGPQKVSGCACMSNRSSGHKFSLFSLYRCAKSTSYPLPSLSGLRHPIWLPLLRDPHPTLILPHRFHVPLTASDKPHLCLPFFNHTLLIVSALHWPDLQASFNQPNFQSQLHLGMTVCHHGAQQKLPKSSTNAHIPAESTFYRCGGGAGAIYTCVCACAFVGACGDQRAASEPAE